MNTADLFRPLIPRRTSDRVATVIRTKILEGKFQPGDRLPPERTLAERFRVTRNTVREALRQLERMRLVTIRHGSGVRVQDYLATAGLEFLGALLTSGPDRQQLLGDLLQARQVLGKAICQHAIEHFDFAAADKFAEAAEQLAAEASKPAPDLRALQWLDFEAQSCLIRGGGNRTFILLHNSLRHVYERVAHMFEGIVADPNRLGDSYRKAAEALTAGDREAARRAFDAIFAAGGSE